MDNYVEVAGPESDWSEAEAAGGIAVDADEGPEALAAPVVAPEEAAAEELQWPWSVIRESAPHRYVTLDRAAGGFVGTMHNMGPYSLKATCKQHRSCTCWVTLRGPRTNKEEFDSLEMDLICWLAHGLTDAAAEHRSRSVEVRRTKGMAVRTPR